MTINNFRLRVVGLAVGVAAAFGAFGLTGLAAGEAAAAPTHCVAANGHQVERISGLSGCGAKAGPRSSATALEESGAGTAVAVSETGGNATARNLQPSSTALAGAHSGGTSYSITTGPKALSVAQARKGGTSIAVGGFGGQAYAGQYGATCQGGFATALDTTSGKGCLRWGSVNLSN